MRCNGVAAILLASITFLTSAGLARAQTVPTQAEVQSRLDELHRWIGGGDKGARWQKFLKSDLLAAELAKGANASPQVIAEVLAQYESGKPGLEIHRFQSVRQALLAWQAELSRLQPQDLPQAVRAAAGKFK